MMFVDFLALLLVNMVAGFVLLAVYVFKGLDDQEQRHWAPGLAICGGIALVFGAYITACWPLPGSYNVAYGEMSVLFGAIFLATAVAMLAGWQLTSVAGYAFFAGLAAVVVGVRILNLGLTQAPL